MNVLAHFALSGDNDNIKLGNFLGDSIRGSDHKVYNGDIQKGILLHRSIDTFTDQHAITAKSRKRIRAKHGKFSGVIMDIYYDHFLVKDWSKHHSSDFSGFENEIYELLKKNYFILPTKTRRFARYMISNQIISGYGSFEKLEEVFIGISGRTKYKSNMASACYDLRMNYDEIKADFEEFYPELKEFSKDFLRKK